MIANFSRFLAFAKKKKNSTTKVELDAVVDQKVGEDFLKILRKSCKASGSTVINYGKAIRTCLKNTFDEWPGLAPKSLRFREDLRFSYKFWKMESVAIAQEIQRTRKKKLAQN